MRHVRRSSLPHGADCEPSPTDDPLSAQWFSEEHCAGRTEESQRVLHEADSSAKADIQMAPLTTHSQGGHCFVPRSVHHVNTLPPCAEEYRNNASIFFHRPRHAVANNRSKKDTRRWVRAATQVALHATPKPAGTGTCSTLCPPASPRRMSVFEGEQCSPGRRAMGSGGGLLRQCYTWSACHEAWLSRAPEGSVSAHRYILLLGRASSSLPCP